MDKRIWARRRCVLLAALLCAFVRVASGAVVDPTVVTDLRIVRGATEAEAREACAAMCPCRDTLTQHVTSNWFMVGANLNRDPSRSDPEDANAFVHLCMRQDRRTAVEKDGAALFAIQSVVVLEQRCPRSMVLLSTLRTGFVVCMQLLPITFALARGMYVSDITATNWTATSRTEKGYTSVRVSAHTDDYIAGPVPVFIQFKRPLRPIVGVQVVPVEGDDISGSMACRAQLNASWEDVGGGFIHAKPSATALRTALCVQRATDVEIDGKTRPVLTGVQVISPSANCPSAYTQAITLSSDWKACLEFQASAATPFITQLMLVSRRQDEQDESWPQDLTVAATADLSGGHDSHSTYLVLQRSDTAAQRVLREQAARAKKSTQPPIIPLSQKPKLQARSQIVVPSVSTKLLRANSDNQAISTEPSTPQTETQLTFKILQLADLHLTGNPDHFCRNPPTEYTRCGLRCTENLTMAFVNDLLDAEKPDMVVFSGDGISVGEWKFKDAAIETVLAPVEQRGIPYAWIMGNHDDDYAYTREEIMDKLLRRPLAYVDSGPSDIQGVGNYELTIDAPMDGPWGVKGSTVFRLYFLDSNKNRDQVRFPKINSRYDWIRTEQIAFYRNLSETHRATRSETLPAIMFFHIPIPEYAASGSIYARSGAKNEKTEGPDFNSGLFDTLVELEEVKATFVGHDHTNEYCYKQRGLQLCYGGGTGFGAAYGSSSVARRARVIEWSVDARNRRVIRSWKRHFGRHFPHRRSEEVLYSEA